MPNYPAAFINNIAEEGTKREAIEWLQQIWNEKCELEERFNLAKRIITNAQKSREEGHADEVNYLNALGLVLLKGKLKDDEGAYFKWIEWTSGERA